MSINKILIFTNIAAEFNFMQSIETHLRNSNIEVLHESDFIERNDIFNDNHRILSMIFDVKSVTRTLIMRSGSIGQRILEVYRLIASVYAEISNFKRFKYLLTEIKPDLILVGTDNTYKTLNLVAMCGRKSVPIVCLPYSLSNSEELLFSAQNTGRLCGKTCSYIIEKLSQTSILKRLTKFYKNLDGNMIPCPVKTSAIIQLILRIDPRDPWVICGGNSNYVFVGSQFEKNYYEKAGVPKHKIRIYSLGKSNDENKFVGSLPPNSLSLTSDIVWAPPPDFYPNQFFENYEDFIIFMDDILGKTGLSVKISLHPRSKYKFFQELVKSNNVEVSEAPIRELLRHTKSFIASQSATIRFALMEKIPIVNFDVFNFNYSEYLALPMVKNIKNPSEFIQIMQIFSTHGFSSNWGYDNYPEDFFSARFPDLINELLSIKGVVSGDSKLL